MLKGKAPLIIALGLAIAAALLVHYTISSKEAALRSQWALEPVVVAAYDIAEGTELKLDMLATFDTPVQFVTASVVKPSQVDRVLGQKLMVPLRGGDPILWNQFYSGGTNTRLSEIVNKHRRAISLDISGAKGVGGWIRPNDHVDILLTTQDPKNDQLYSTTILQNVAVLAAGDVSTVDREASREEGGRDHGVFTFQVTPKEAEILAVAAEKGSLRLVLRNLRDISVDPDHSKTTEREAINGVPQKSRPPRPIVDRLDEE